MPDPIIRPLRSDDRAAWDRLWGAYLDFYQTALPPEVYEATFTRLLDPGMPDMNGLIAIEDGTPTGLVHYIRHRHCWRVEDVCYLQDLFVDAEARGGGIGRALIEAVYAAADAAGTPSVYWLTQEFNDSARQLYDRIGRFTPFVKYVRG
ncbi:GNAT superfamily N-acetyltransferase [Rhodovulum iodosum]|uniref:GNAT superfamily N-acetyltransferase n=1 Tax=Rhodovulum iodosum TaxID=68291 RepID=A0ABV3XXC6_9RHOB|nr:GNAT family N-acetyltransferase [Rhodovulum robiginosum]RSK33432.1 GNAT family N-acetyltransferase [Rhodovulum robiginosum]